MKIQPIESHARPLEAATRFEPVKLVAKSRFKRLFERQFTSVLRTTTPAAAAEEKEKVVVGGVEELHFNKDGFTDLAGGEFEPSSVCLANMVQNFIEESNEKQSAVRCSRNRCNCFNGNCDDSSDDESEPFGFGDSNLASSGEACELLKSLVSCPSLCERNLLADTARIVEKNKMCKRKDDNGRLVVTDNLLALGYDASVCKTRWEKSPSYPSGEYEYIDVIIKGERLLIDVDFRSEFEIARPTKSYKAILQTLPYIFVGKPDRLRRIIGIVSEAGKQSLKKKGMHVPPWRKAEYIKAKWLSPHTRATASINSSPDSLPEKTETQSLIKSMEFEQSRTELAKSVDSSEPEESVFELSEGEEEKAAVKEWKPPEVKPRRSSGVKIVTGLASVMEDENEP
ncbi:hypothetical protein ABKV19_018310 [Rosa sericea]